MSESTEGNASQVAAPYEFVRTPGRARVITAYDELLAAFAERVEAHRTNHNEELREVVGNIAQRSLLDFERLCEKWIQADAHGVTY